MTILSTQGTLYQGHPDHLRTRGHQEEKGLQVRDHLVVLLEVLRANHQHRPPRHLLHRRRLLLRTLHRVLQESLQYLSYQHLHTRRSPMSRHQRTSRRQRSGIAFDDKPSSTLRKIDGTSTMTRK